MLLKIKKPIRQLANGFFFCGERGIRTMQPSFFILVVKLAIILLFAMVIVRFYLVLQHSEI